MCGHNGLYRPQKGGNTAAPTLLPLEVQAENLDEPRFAQLR